MSDNATRCPGCYEDNAPHLASCNKPVGNTRQFGPGEVTKMAANDGRERVVEAARQWLREHQPEPLKCMYCDVATSFAPIASGFAQSCESNSQGHAYMVDFGGESKEADQLADFALAHSAELQRRLDEAERNLKASYGHHSAAEVAVKAAEAKAERYRLALERIKAIPHSYTPEGMWKALDAIDKEIEQALSEEVKS